MPDAVIDDSLINAAAGEGRDEAVPEYVPALEHLAFRHLGQHFLEERRERYGAGSQLPLVAFLLPDTWPWCAGGSATHI